VTYETVRRMGLALPDVEEGTSYGTPALKVRGSLMTRLWEDGKTLVMKTTIEEREELVGADPAAEGASRRAERSAARRASPRLVGDETAAQEVRAQATMNV
jgi:hypothetical protein